MFASREGPENKKNQQLTKDCWKLHAKTDGPTFYCFSLLLYPNMVTTLQTWFAKLEKTFNVVNKKKKC